jgi:type II secretory pathway pseudopilin PulG
MRTTFVSTSRSRGSSLIETVIAMGVLAVAIPLVFGALAESGKSGMSSEAETRSTWMIPACMEEIQASRENRPQFFTNTTVGQTFPPAGDVWALAFSPEGKPVGKISKAIYDKGTKEVDGQPVRYIASLDSKLPTTTTGATPMLSMHISLEYPASSPAAKRQKLEFYTRIP